MPDPSAYQAAYIAAALRQAGLPLHPEIWAYLTPRVHDPDGARIRAARIRYYDQPGLTWTEICRLADMGYCRRYPVAVVGEQRARYPVCHHWHETREAAIRCGEQFRRCAETRGQYAPVRMPGQPPDRRRRRWNIGIDQEEVSDWRIYTQPRADDETLPPAYPAAMIRADLRARRLGIRITPLVLRAGWKHFRYPTGLLLQAERRRGGGGWQDAARRLLAPDRWRVYGIVNSATAMPAAAWSNAGPWLRPLCAHRHRSPENALRCGAKYMRRSGDDDDGAPRRLHWNGRHQGGYDPASVPGDRNWQLRRHNGWEWEYAGDAPQAGPALDAALRRKGEPRRRSRQAA